MKKTWWMVLFWMAGLGAQAQAASLEGLSFDDQVTVDQKELRLNGLGLRSVFIFKAYVMGLYLPEKSTKPTEVLRGSGPKRLHMRLLMDFSAADIKKALLDGIQKNSTEAEWQGMQPRLAVFTQTIDAIGHAKVGDAITMDFVPDRGLVLSVNQVVKGQAVPGADIYRKLLEIFIGDAPVDSRLKNGMLGL